MNGLLSLKTFRTLIPFMKEDIQNILCGVLNNDLHDLEQLRSKLHSFCVENATGSFPRSTHSDPVEALTRLIEMINMAHLHQETLVDIKLHNTCNGCGDKTSHSLDNPWNMPNVLPLTLSNKQTVQEELNEYLKQKNKTELKTLYCRKCQVFQLKTTEQTIETNDILILSICRFKDNGDKIHDTVIPNEKLVVGSSNYQLRGLCAHHGYDYEEGHYKYSILVRDAWYLLNDFNCRKPSEEDIVHSYMIFYERVSNSELQPDEDANLEEIEQEDDIEIESDFINPEHPSSSANISSKENSKNNGPYDKISTKVDLEEGIVTIDAPVDMKAPVKARIVDKNGTLKIQCLNCMKTVQNIITHAVKKQCKDAFPISYELEELRDRMKKLQKARRNKKDWEKNKNARNKKARANYATDSKQKKDASKEAYRKNPIPQLEASKEAYISNPGYYKKAFKENYNQRKKLLGRDDNGIINNFYKKQAQGQYACICCHRLLFKSSVVKFDKEDPNNEIVKAIQFFDLHHCITTDESCKYDGQFWLCHNCKNNLKEGKMPNMCWANGLAVSSMPDELADLTDLEHLMIKKNLVFIKIKPKLSTGMKVMHGNCINVPITNDDLLRTSTYLPRKEDDLATVNVAFKRMRKSPYYHR